MGNGTSIGRVRGLGSAHSGTHHWLLQRLTALGNLALMAYLLVSLTAWDNWSYGGIIAWLKLPLPPFALALFVVSVFWHARLGLQVLIEDYVHGANKVAVITALNLAAFGGAAAGLFFIARIVFAAAGAEAAAGALQSLQGGH